MDKSAPSQESRDNIASRTGPANQVPALRLAALADVPLLNLQRTIGNQAVLRLLDIGAIQTELRISQPGDADEIEADRVAEHVVASSSAPALQREGCPTEATSCPEYDQKSLKSIHRKGKSLSQNNETVSDEFAKSLDPGQPLVPSVRSFMESRFGHDFSRVRVHTYSRGSAATLNAQAFTVTRMATRLNLRWRSRRLLVQPQPRKVLLKQEHLKWSRVWISFFTTGVANLCPNQ